MRPFRERCQKPFEFRRLILIVVHPMADADNLNAGLIECHVCLHIQREIVRGLRLFAAAEEYEIVFAIVEQRRVRIRSRRNRPVD